MCWIEDLHVEGSVGSLDLVPIVEEKMLLGLSQSSEEFGMSLAQFFKFQILCPLNFIENVGEKRPLRDADHDAASCSLATSCSLARLLIIPYNN